MFRRGIMNDFMKATLIRCLRTMAQTAISVIGTAMVLADVNWQMVVSASVLAGILSILTSIATGLPEVDLAEELEDEEELDEDDEWSGKEDDMQVEPYEGDESGEVEEE